MLQLRDRMRSIKSRVAVGPYCTKMDANLGPPWYFLPHHLGMHSRILTACYSLPAAGALYDVGSSRTASLSLQIVANAYLDRQCQFAQAREPASRFQAPLPL